MTYFHFERSFEFSMAEVVKTNAGAASYCLIDFLFDVVLMLSSNCPLICP